jgi:hypothetical protein
MSPILLASNEALGLDHVSVVPAAAAFAGLVSFAALAARAGDGPKAIAAASPIPRAQRKAFFEMIFTFFLLPYPLHGSLEAPWIFTMKP